MKPINETHPSLKPDYCNADVVLGDEKLVKRTFHYSEENIQKHTIDKAVLKDWVKEFFEKFDAFACVKDDKWYKDYKKEKYKELGLVECEETIDEIIKTIWPNGVKITDVEEE